METRKENRANKLINEKSPYLLQHARNPVDWHPWGDEAFERARSEDKPIFLSIGYSTCHWCHVMERESFENEQVAGLLNDAFVPIKVDREERPDIDDYYMTVCQLMTGGGGWPLSIFMTPDRKPFLAATYIPRESMFGRTGMIDLIPRLKHLWMNERPKIREAAGQIVNTMTNIQQDASGEAPGRETLDAAYRGIRRIFDDANGGFGDAPKFPTPHMLYFLMRYWKRSGESDALRMVERTLNAMRSGGIHDHVGRGYHRYATDARWLVPHFEKMLYDQALIAIAFIETYQATGDDRQRRGAEEIFEYVLRDMTDPGGGFYSAEDADSEGVEGKFYVWTADEIRRFLARDEAELVIAVYNVEEGGNFREESTGGKTGANILHMTKPIEQIASEMGLPEDELSVRLEAALRKLFEGREKRVHPLKDDKVLTDWNGLMIAALAMAAKAFDKPEYAHAAITAVDFILDKMRSPGGGLYHRYRQGEAAIPAFMEDYAFFSWGLIELYDAVFDPRYLEEAVRWTNYMVEHFWDDDGGGLYLTSAGSSELPARKKEVYDGATPSGNSVAMLNLLRLGRMTGDTDYEVKADRIARTFAKRVEQNPVAHTHLLTALDFAIGPTREAVIVGDPAGEDTRAMTRLLGRSFTPGLTVLLKPTEDESVAEKLTELAPFIADLTAIDGKSTAYICRGRQCEAPTTDIEEMASEL